MSEETRVLVAEGCQRTRTTLLAHLSADGLEAIGAQTEAEARLKLRTSAPGVVVLGAIGEPRAALVLLRELRRGEAGCDPSVAVVALGASAGGLELLRAFEAGADHYMPRPPAYLELRARVRACIQRRRGWARPRALNVGALALDRDQHRATYAGRTLELSRMEFALLGQLASEPRRVFTKAILLREVWGYLSPGRTRTVDAHACRLRKKLEAAGARGHLLNVRGVGYRLLDGEPASEAEEVPGTLVPIERGRHAA
jgi:DNA-binding response OmpR family regulator